MSDDRHTSDDQHTREVHEYWKDRNFPLKSLINEVMISQLSDIVMEYLIMEKSTNSRSFGYFNEIHQKEGPWITYYPNNNIESKGFYFEDKQEGPWSFYHENGVIRYEIECCLDTYHGLCTSYYKDGIKASKGQYYVTNQEGMWASWCDGASFSQGLREGEWEFWWPNGSRQAKGTYRTNLKLPGWEYWEYWEQREN